MSASCSSLAALRAGVRAIEARERLSLNYAQMIRLARRARRRSIDDHRPGRRPCRGMTDRSRKSLRRSGEQDASYAGHWLRCVSAGVGADDRCGA